MAKERVVCQNQWPSRPRCWRCDLPLRNAHGQPYTPGDDVDHDGLCQWCRDWMARHG